MMSETTGCQPGVGNMSFNPYNKRAPILPSNEDTIGNNDTKMSNNEAFLAFLQKNDSDDDENESNNQEEQWIEYKPSKFTLKVEERSIREKSTE